MTVSIDIAGAYEAILASCGGLLRPSGYTRRGAILRRVVEGNAALIEFQKSTGSSREHLRFTVNIGVVCGPLLDPERTSVTKSSIVHAHLRERIGSFMPEPDDKWWTIEPGADVETIAAEVSGLLVDHVVPYLEKHVRTRDLVDMWKAGVSPGLTKSQRLQYLGRLAS